jgi:hypothetical protein
LKSYALPTDYPMIAKVWAISSHLGRYCLDRNTCGGNLRVISVAS